MKECVSSRLLPRGASMLWAARGRGTHKPLRQVCQTPFCRTRLMTGTAWRKPVGGAREAEAVTPGSLAPIMPKLRVVGERALSYKMFSWQFYLRPVLPLPSLSKLRLCSIPGHLRRAP